LRVSRVIAKLLKEFGISVVAGAPGTTELVLVTDLLSEGIPYIFTLHDSVAVGVADGMARALGRPVVASLHASQGILNAAGFIRVAKRDNSPVVILAGAPATTYSIYEPNHFVHNICSILDPITKWGWMITNTSQIQHALKRAFYIAASPPMGPTYILVPQDLLEMLVGKEVINSTEGLNIVENLMMPDESLIKDVAFAIYQAQAPVFFVGSGICRYHAQNTLNEFVHQTKIPVIGEALDRGPMLLGKYLPGNEELFLGYFDIRDPTMHKFLQDNDLIIFIGCKSTYEKVIGKLKSDSIVIQVDDHTEAIGKTHRSDLYLIGNIKKILEQLAKHYEQLNGSGLPKPVNRDRWFRIARKSIQQTRAKSQTLLKKTRKLLTGIEVVDVINTIPVKDKVLVDDSQCFSYYLKHFVDLEKTGAIYGSSASHIGWALPAALGIKLALREQPVICTVSDASFLFSLQALATAATYGIGIIVIVINNKGFVSLKLETKRKFTESSRVLDCLSIDNPEYNLADIARSFGINSFRVSEKEALRTAFQQAIHSDVTTVVEVLVSEKEKDWEQSWYV